MNTPRTPHLPLLALCLALTAAAGCAQAPLREAAAPRAFDFNQDSFTFANELKWEYVFDPLTRETTTRQNQPEPEFAHRCFAVVRMARQFFQYARFDPASPRADEETYRRVVAAVLSRRPGDAPPGERIAIPGYANLRSFSLDQEAMLKAATGSSLHSYFQFSNWRMVFPFSRDNQEETARHLVAEVAANRLPIVHLIRFDTFPVTRIDHAIMIIAAVEVAGEIRFRIYDPNVAQQPGLLTFDDASRTYILPATKYFKDGPLDLYEIDRDQIN